LADVLEGSISLTSVLGKGSTFTLEIPPVLQSISEPSRLASTFKPEAADHAPSAPDREALVLVVDDDPAFRYALSQMILADNRTYAVAEAPDGEQCLTSARALKPDVIILDLQMPRRDGYQVLQDLAADPATRDIPVLISSSADLDAIESSRISTAQAFLSKRELNPQSIATALGRILEGRQ
jgi:CheY-like chemotaxis protein